MNDQKKIWPQNSSSPLQPQAPVASVSSGSDTDLQSKSHDRGYNPADSAPRGSIGAALNQDAARYKKGPAPL